MALIAAGRRDALPAIGACCPLPSGANSYIYTPERRAGAAPSPRRAAGCACAADKRPPGPQGGILPVPAQAQPRARFALCAASGDATAATRLAFCAEISLDADGKAPEWIQLFPRGPQLRANDGRRWRLADPQAVASATAARWGGVDLKIDWEHAHEIKAGSGERVATAGWIKQLAVRDGLLMGRVEWTAAGRQSVESQEYRYVSPAFAHANSIKLPGQPDGGDITTLASVALVGRPAFDMPALAGQQERQQRQQEESMLKKILEALGLAGDSTEEQALAALAKLKSDLGDAQSLAANPPVEKFVPRELYASALARAETAEGKLASQAKEALAAEAKRELDAAQAAGKFTPAQRPWFDARCAEEGGLEKIRELLGKSASAAPGPGGGSPEPPKATAAGFASDEEASIASMFRRDAKFLNEHAPRSDSQGVS